MKFAFIADLHFRHADLKVAQEQLRQSLTIAMDRGAIAVIFPGDVYDRPNIVDAPSSTGDIVSALKEVLGEFLFEYGYHFLPGQHDKASNQKLSALQVLRGMPVCTIHEEPGWELFHGEHDEPEFIVGVAMLPWHFSPSATGMIHQLEAKKYAGLDRTILAAHLQVKHFKMDGGEICTAGYFTTTKEELEATKFDRFAFGDFHMRQEVVPGRGGYVGFNRHLRMGTDDYPQGFELYDAVSNTAQWIEVDHAPRYVTREWYPDTERPSLDVPNAVIRLRPVGWVPNDEELHGVSEEVIVDPVPPDEPVVSRVENMEHNIASDLHAVLDMFLDQMDYDGKRDELHQELDTIKPENLDTMQSWVSPEGIKRQGFRTISTRIKGFGEFNDISADWRAFNDTVVLVGDVGDGKTIFAGAWFAAAFGEFPGYADETIFQRLTTGGSGRGSVEWKFQCGGRVYTALREVIQYRTSTAHSATLSWEENGQVQSVGPNVGEFAEKIESLIGTKEENYLTAFGGQDDLRNICTMSRIEKRRFAERVLRLQPLTATSDAAKAEAGRVEKAIDRINEHEERAPTLKEHLRTIRQSLKERGLRIERLKAIRTTIQRSLDSLADRMGALQADAADIQKQASVLSLARQVSENVQSTKAEIQRIDALGEQLPACLQAEEDATALQRGIDQSEAYHQFKDSASFLDKQVSEARKKLEKYASSEQLEQHESLLEGLKTERTISLRKYNEATEERQRAENNHVHMSRQLASMGDKEEPVCPAGDLAASDCALFKSAWERYQERPQLQAAAEKLSEEIVRLRGIEQAAKEICEQWDAKHEQKRQEVQSLRQAKRMASEAQDDLLRYEDARARLTAPILTVDLIDRAGIIEARAQLKALREKAARRSSIEADVMRLPTLRDQLQRSEKELADLGVKAQDIPADSEERHQVASASVSAMQKRIGILRKRMESIDVDLQLTIEKRSDGRALESRGAADLADIEEAIKDRPRLRARLETLRMLQKAFARDGAQALIVDYRFKSLSESASAILSRATGGAMRCVIKTQSETKKGKVIEDFEVYGITSRGERPYRGHSGGERQLIQSVMMAALPGWLASIYGLKVPEAWMDEVFEKIEPEQAHAIITAMREHYEFVCFITHIKDLAELIPTQITVDHFRSKTLRKSA